MYTNWNERKNLGDKAEELFKMDMQERGFNIIFENPDYSFKPYDYIISKDNKDIKVEVKNDNSSTPNIAVEFSYNGRPSGIAVTDADMFFTFNDGKWYVAYVEELREFIATENPPIRKNTKNKTDTYIYLINKKYFEEYQKGEGQILFTLTPKVQA